MLLGNVAKEFIKGEASKNGAKSTLFTSALVNLNYDSLFADPDCQVLNKDTKELNYPIFIKYQPYMRNGSVKGMNYILGSSILPYKDRTRVFNFEDMKNKASRNETEEDKALKWLIENTDISEEYFTLAKANMGVRIFLNFNMLAYAKKINPDWENYPSYISGADEYLNYAYNELRTKGIQEKVNLNEKVRSKKIKEAKKCQQ